MVRWRRRVAPDADGPLVSVVVPVFNNAAHLASCLDSLLAQPVHSLEVVVVDDGSTDGSAQVAASYAATDPRVQVVSQPNSGVSIARNNALPLCRGRYLTFADGDDVLPPDAWSGMLRTLERTGSDFAVGKAEREEVGESGSRRFVTPLMRRNHGHERLRATIGELPLMVADVFVWNKMFRLDFYRGAGITFPERTRYQDQVAMTQAFLAARSFDVLTEVVYFWRVRPERDSATQRRADLSNLRERISTKHMTVDLVRAHGDPRLLHVLHDEVLPIDMWEHFRAGAAAGGDYWSELVAGTRALWHDGTLPFEATAVPAHQRLMGWLTVRDRHEDLVRWLAVLDDGGPTYTADGRLLHPWETEVELWRPADRGTAAGV